MTPTPLSLLTRFFYLLSGMPMPKTITEPQDGADDTGKEVVTEHPGTVVVSSDVELDVPVRYCWCLDAGHGAWSPDKRSPTVPGGVKIITQQDRLLEWEFNRDIVERLIELMSANGRAYMRTMPAHGKYGNALSERVKAANNHASLYPKLFVSVHGNAGPAKTVEHYHTASGIETWYAHGSSRGRALAAVFQRHLIGGLGMIDRGLKSKPTGQFQVLTQTRMPAILTENGFFNNRGDLKLMLTPEFRQAVADAHFAAIMHVEKNGL